MSVTGASAAPFTQSVAVTSRSALPEPVASSGAEAYFQIPKTPRANTTPRASFIMPPIVIFLSDNYIFLYVPMITLFRLSRQTQISLYYFFSKRENVISAVLPQENCL